MFTEPLYSFQWPVLLSSLTSDQGQQSWHENVMHYGSSLKDFTWTASIKEPMFSLFSVKIKLTKKDFAEISFMLLTTSQSLNLIK